MSAVEVLAGVDIVALRLSEEGTLQVLLLRRQREPYAGQWALPGVLVNGRCADASLDAAAARALADKARLQPQYLEQVATVGNGVRDPRGWSLSTCYLALLASDAEPQDENLRFVELAGVIAGEQALPFDHTQLVRLAAERLRGKSVYSSLPLYLLSGMARRRRWISQEAALKYFLLGAFSKTIESEIEKNLDALLAKSKPAAKKAAGKSVKK